MKNKLKGLLAIGLLSTLLLTSCDREPLPEDFDRANGVIEVTVIWHERQSDVDAAYKEEFGRDNVDRLGFAVWANPSRQPYWCRIHVQKPKSVDDNKMDTLGHEMFHCLTGTFHPEP